MPALHARSDCFISIKCCASVIGRRPLSGVAPAAEVQQDESPAHHDEHGDHDDRNQVPAESHHIGRSRSEQSRCTAGRMDGAVQGKGGFSVTCEGDKCVAPTL
jgi:hypothetical protein